MFVCVCALTGADEELVGDPRVVYVVDGRSEQGSQDLQISEDRLRGQEKDHDEP